MTGSVAADVFVRGRDGRSFLDDDTVSHPDPVRVRAAVAGLEDAGFTVDAVDEVAVTVHGPPAAFTLAFAVQLERGPEAWHVLGLPGTGVFTVDAASPLSGSVHGVLLKSPPRPQARDLHTRLDLFRRGSDDPLAQDLLLGEIGSTLDDPVPNRTAFPAGTAREAVRMTGTRLDAWDRVRTATLGRPPRPRRALRAVVVGEIAARRLREVWDLSLTDDEETVQLPVIEEPLLRATTSADWDLIRAEGGDVFFGRVRPAWAAARRSLETFGTALLPGPAAADGIEAVRTRWTATKVTWDSVFDAVHALDLGPTGDDQHLQVAVGVLDLTVQDVGKLVAAPGFDLSAPSAAHLGAAVAKVLALAPAFDDQLRATQTAYEGVFTKTLAERRWHAAMVGNAFLAVSGEVVHLAMPCGARPTGTRRHRTIFSVSIGAHEGKENPDTLRRMRAERRRRWCGLTRAFQLTVIAVGNNPVAEGFPQEPSRMNLDAALVADQENVLVVGGCRPNGDRWEATRATHGYRYTPPGADDPVDLPHLCATTKGETGGAVVFPDSEEPPVWWLGQGSSLSTPIVAAVCGLVWTAYPGLSAGQVKTAVLASTAKLAGGTFDTPRGTDALASASVKGIPRVHLGQALDKAAGFATGTPRHIANAP